MTQPIQLTLPLSATALRLGAEFLNTLAAQADVIRTEERGPQTIGELSYTLDVDTTAAVVALEELAAPAETEAERIQRLHGNVGSAGMEPPAPKVEYETQVIGVERNPEYAGDLAAFEHEALAEAGWTDEALIGVGYLVEVTAQVPKEPAVATAPTPPAPPGAASAAQGVELDADGLPWDERIHSDATERKAKTGKWKTRKNLAPGYKEQIEGELRARATGTTVSPSAPAQPPAAPSAPPAAPPAPAAAAAPAAPTPPNAPGTPGAMDFPAFTRWALGHVNNKQRNPDGPGFSNTDVALAIQAVGLTIMPDLAKQPDKIAPVVADLKAKFGLE